MNRRGAHMIVPWAITALSLAVTVGVFAASWRAVDSRADDRLRSYAGTVARSTTAELHRYADALSAAVGFVRDAGGDTPTDLDLVVEALDLPERYYGAEAILRVGRTPDGSAIEVLDLGGARLLAPGDALPLDDAAAIADALQASRESRDIALSAPFRLASLGDLADHAQVVLAAQLTASQWLVLWLDAPVFVRTANDDLPASYALDLADVTRSSSDGPVPTSGALLGEVTAAGSPTQSVDLDVPVIGRSWRFTVAHAGDLASASERNGPWIVLASGSLLTAAVAAAFAVQARGRRREVDLVRQATDSERIRRELADASPLAIIETDAAGIVHGWNPAAGALLGVDPSDAVGRPLVLPLTAGAAQFAGRDQIRELHGRRSSLATPSGERVVTMFTSASDERRCVLILIDETEQLALEHRLERAQRLEMLGRLTGGIAHDFNNFLTPIVGYVDLVLLRGEISSTDRAALQEARRAADRAAALVGKLLTVGRHQATATPGAIDVTTSIVDLTALLTAAAGNDVALVTDLSRASEAALVAMDRTQLEQVLLNLVVNAREAISGAGRIVVSVRVEPALVTLSVADDGHGMDAATRTSMFEPFFATKHDRGGTGLGLATVFSIVASAGGDIAVDSEIDRGTTFTITLPRVLGTLGEAEAAASRPALSGRCATTVLLVEDDPSVRRLTAAILASEGFTVTPVASADEAGAAFDEHPDHVDLLLTDVVLRGTNGIELARRLTARRPGLPVLFMSGYADGAIGASGQLPPGGRLLTKPFRAAELVRQVHETLTAAAVGMSAAAAESGPGSSA